MNYELAKKLKEAGWPQHVDTDPHVRTYYFIREDDLSFVHQGGLDYPPHGDNAHDEGDIMLAPTLSELIEACGKEKEGDRFFLEASGEYWIAGFQATYNKSQRDIGIQATGSTPEEAVANLWLKINGK